MRRAGGIRLRLAVGVSGLLLVAGPDARAGGLSPGELRGKEFYVHGKSASGGEPTAFVGSESVELPASAVTCASCHGPDGLGRPEGGLTPTDIRWSQLTKSYGHVHDNGRRHPPFDEESLGRLLKTGIDPGGTRVDTAAMPIYAMSERDMADLIAYLKRLETDTDPGVGPDRLRVGTLLPLRGPQGELGQAMARVLGAYLQDVNDRGGIFGRRIELVVVPFGGSQDETLGDVRRALEQEGIFALVGPYTVGLDEPLLALLKDQGIPLVGAFTLDPGDEVDNDNAFYLYPGFAEQARAMAAQALREGKGASPLMLVGPEGPQTDRLAEAVRAEVRGRRGPPPAVVRYAGGGMDVEALAARAVAESTEALLFFGSQGELEALLRGLAARRHTPRVYLLGESMTRPLYDVPEAFDRRVFLAYPTVPGDVSAQGRAEYQRLASRHGLPGGHVQGQMAAYAAADLLVAGWRGAGRELTRLGLMGALEALYSYETGVTPRLTYGPNRRIGARGAHLMVVDIGERRYRPAGPWVEITE